MSASARITKLERAIRKAAREEFVNGVCNDFQAAIARASGNPAAMAPLLDAHECVIKAGAKAAENAALERFLAEKAPEPAPTPLISLDALYKPDAVKIAANGERLPDTATEYVAVLLPQFDMLYTAETWVASNWSEAIRIGAEVDLFDGAGKWQLWDDIEAGLTIDRSVDGPAVIPAFRDCAPMDRFYWTKKVDQSSPSDCAICVDLRSGGVGWNGKGYAGRVRAVCRVPASQF